MMKLLVFLMIISTNQLFSSQAQDCERGQELLNSALRQMMKTLSTHETSFIHSLRSLRKKLSLIHNTTSKHSRANTGRNSTGSACPPPEPLVNGRILGRVFRTGHEIHYLCDPGFQRMGAETRVCLESLRWSDTPPSCHTADTDSAVNDEESTTVPSSSLLSSVYMMTSHCVEYLDSTRCSCDPGFSISSLNRSLCTDIDECELFRQTPPGRVCLHTCVNTAGSFHCHCPDGYSLGRDSRSCHDVDECAQTAHKCSSEQVCVNTYGGYRCEHVHCPPFLNASYIRTSALRCERNPCVEGDAACLQAPVSVNFHFMSVVSNMTVPTVLFRLSAARLLGDSLRFGLLGNTGVQQFSVQRSGRQTAQLLLLQSIQGPAELKVDVEMSETERRQLIGRYLTRVTLFISPYSF